jgi:predicted protein tyrosine phosphatase
MRMAECMKKVLFVCTGNLQRSPTAEDLFRNWDGVWETRSAGTEPVAGRRAVTQELADCADLIICMEPEHAEFVETNFKCPLSKMRVLYIADRYLRNDPELVRELQRKVSPILREEQRLN